MPKKKTDAIDALDLSKFHSMRIMIVGLGGTGSHLVSSLCQLVSSSSVLKSHVSMIFVDGDHVEKKNLRNQKFLPEDVGKPKAEVLYQRYQDVYPDIDLSYVPSYIESTKDFEEIFSRMSGSRFYQLDVIVGCVDNLKARKIMDDYFKKRKNSSELLYIDTGNGIGETLTGQTVIGRSSKDFNTKTRGEEDEDASFKCLTLLPPVSVYFPEILTGEDQERELSCGEVDESMVQNLGANIMSAANVFNILNGIMTFQRLPGNMFLFDARTNTLTKAV